MTIENGQIADATEVMNALASNFVDTAQMIYNAKYNGFATNLGGAATPNLKNVFYSTFESDDADINYGFIYDPINDLYETPDLTTGLTEYIIIEAASLSAPWDSNNVKTLQISSGKWLVYCTSGTDAVRRAQIHKSLWYGTDGTDALMDDFTSVTAVKTTHANDVDKRATLAKLDYVSNNVTSTYTGTFNDTTTNNNSSVWSRVKATTVGTSGGALTVRTEFASGNTVNSVSIGANSTATSDEFGTDTSGDELTNPADIQLEHTSSFPNTNTSDIDVVILHEGTITWSLVGGATVSEKDYTTDDSIPVMTSAGTLSAEGVGNSTLIFKNTASASVTNAIASINSTIDATSSQQISISADGGVNYTNVNNGEIARPTAGTALWRKIVVTRATLDKLDKVTEQAVKYNFY